MNLDDFIAQSSHGVRNLYVDEPEFDSLYVRSTIRYLNGGMVPTIDLASITATTPNNGAFTRLVDRLSKKYPDRIIFVECVLTERFKSKLIKMGFVECNVPGNFYLPKQL